MTEQEEYFLKIINKILYNKSDLDNAELVEEFGLDITDIIVDAIYNKLSSMSVEDIIERYL